MDVKALSYQDLLVLLLQQLVSCMNYLQAVPSRALAVAAHIQQLALELAGLKTYLTIVVPCMQSSQDFSWSILDVVGGFLREGTVMQTWHRLGILYWVLQPLTKYVVVYRVVREDALLYDLAHLECDPPILHHAGSFVGVVNLTGNWISSMVVSTSKHFAGSHLSALNLVTFPDVPSTEEPSGKHPRIEERDMASSHLSMRPAGADVPKSKGARRCQHCKAGGRPSEEGTSTSTAAVEQQLPDHVIATDPTSFEHPLHTFILSPFVEVLDLWADALHTVSPVPQNHNSALYFFPLPYLLDTICSTTEAPSGCWHPDRACIDTKIHQYLHNLICIRAFCRLCLFDISLDNQPLSIVEWHAALWGNYLPQSSVCAGGEGAEAHRAKHRLGECNGVGVLFHKVTHMDTYSPDAIMTYEGRDLDLLSITTNVSIR